MTAARLATPRGEYVRRDRVIPPRIETFKIPAELCVAIGWRVTMDGYRAGKLDL